MSLITAPSSQGKVSLKVVLDKGEVLLDESILGEDKLRGKRT